MQLASARVRASINNTFGEKSYEPLAPLAVQINPEIRVKPFKHRQFKSFLPGETQQQLSLDAMFELLERHLRGCVAFAAPSGLSVVCLAAPIAAALRPRAGPAAPSSVLMGQ